MAMFSGLKSFFNNVKTFFDNLFHGRVTLSSSLDAYNEMIGKKKSFENNALANNGYSDVAGTPDLYQSYNATGQSALQSWANKTSEAGLTGQQIALNEMQLDNARRQYAFQVQGMQEAGLNPALMYESGAMSPPSAPSPTQGASMSELLQAMLFQKQAALLDAQARNTDADTDKKKAETAQVNLINQYYPKVTDTTIDKMLTEMGLDKENINKVRGEVDLQELDKELKRLDQVIKRAEADESSAYFKAVREFQEASSEKVKAEKAELVVRAAMETLEKDYMKETNTKMGTANVLAIASFLGTVGTNIGSEIGEGIDGLFDIEGFKEDMRKWIPKLIEWINKPKEVF